MIKNLFASILNQGVCKKTRWAAPSLNADTRKWGTKTVLRNHSFTSAGHAKHCCLLLEPLPGRIKTVDLSLHYFRRLCYLHRAPLISFTPPGSSTDTPAFLARSSQRQLRHRKSAFHQGIREAVAALSFVLAGSQIFVSTTQNAMARGSRSTPPFSFDHPLFRCSSKAKSSAACCCQHMYEPSCNSSIDLIFFEVFSNRIQTKCVCSHDLLSC